MNMFHKCFVKLINSGPTEPGYAQPMQSVHPDKLASEEAN